MSVVLRAKAPLRISFAGGGTDVSPFPEREGGLVLNATISRYAHGTLRTRSDDQIRIESVDLGVTATFAGDDPLDFDGSLDLVKAAIRRVADRGSGGFDLFLRSGARPGSGLGSSSSMMVVLVGLLRDARHLKLSDYDIAELAHHIERHELGVRGGKQDHYATVFGGFNFIEFTADQVIVNPLRISPDVVHELEHNMLLCFTGATRASDHIITDQMDRFDAGEEATLEGLRRQKVLVVEMKNALLQRRLPAFGELLHEAWKAKREISPLIATSRIDELYALARANGAIGGKITGAGGGGYMLLYCEGDRRHHVADALRAEGVEVGDVTFEWDGLRTWNADDGY